MYLPYIFQVLYVLCFTRPRYQVSVYRTIGPLVLTLQKHVLHQSCSSEYYDNNLIFHIFVASCPLFVLTVRQCRAS